MEQSQKEAVLELRLKKPNSNSSAFF